MTGPSPDLLAAMVAATRVRVASSRERESDSSLLRRALARQPDGRAFVDALTRRDRIHVVAECKRRSPSRGVLRAAYDPVEIARDYQRAGAAAISVLTEPSFFDGALDHLEAVRAAVSLPLLRKDFIVDEYQLLEARAAGANAVLLIVAALDDEELARLSAATSALGLAALVEVHNVAECERALAVGARVIGVNNRNLRTLEVDLKASEAIAAMLPSDVVSISESGLKTADDLRRLRSLGYRAFLMGERFMIEPLPGDALSQLLASVTEGAGARPQMTQIPQTGALGAP
ncbi:MAG: indole-3-glycerol phosphate synthase TrpC [Vicinamibacterales bacterium]